MVLLLLQAAEDQVCLLNLSNKLSIIGEKPEQRRFQKYGAHLFRWVPSKFGHHTRTLDGLHIQVCILVRESKEEGKEATVLSVKNATHTYRWQFDKEWLRGSVWVLF